MAQNQPNSQGPDGHGTATDDLKNSASDVADNVRAMGGQVGKAAREQYENLRDRASEYVEQGKEKAQEWESELEGYIKDNPMRALLIAAGAGVILGWLWRRR